MAIQLIGSTSGNVAEVDLDNAVKVQLRNPAVGALGAYSMGLSTGALAATLGAGSKLFYFRWSDATRLALIHRIEVAAYVASTITTGVAWDLSLFFDTGFSVSPTTNIGTTATLTGRNGKRRTSMGTTLLSGFWSAGTTGMTGATATVDAQRAGAIIGNTGTVTGTQIFGNNTQVIFDAGAMGGYPLTFAQNEGFEIQNVLAGPATGTITAACIVHWSEVLSY